MPYFFVIFCICSFIVVIDEKQAGIVRWMFDKYIACRSKKAVSLALLEEHGISRTTHGITTTLRNTKYIGQSNGKDGFCPPIVERDTFELAQTIIRQRAQRNGAASPNHVYLFTGIIFCADCGHRLSGHTTQGRYTYYRCTTYETKKACIHTRRTNEAVIEKWLLENILSCAGSYNLELEVKATQGKPVVDEAAVRRKMEKLKDLYLNDLIDRDTYKKDYTALQEKLLTAQEMVRDKQRPIDIPQLRSLLDVYSTLPREGKKEFWTRTISKIIVTNDDNFSLVLISP